MRFYSLHPPPLRLVVPSHPLPTLLPNNTLRHSLRLSPRPRPINLCRHICRQARDGLVNRRDRRLQDQDGARLGGNLTAGAGLGDGLEEGGAACVGLALGLGKGGGGARVKGGGRGAVWS